jgi:hypothetical protein
MEPQIKYPLTEDGVSIAYWTVGDAVLRGFEDPVRLWELRVEEPA